MNIGKESETVEFKKSTSETKEGLISVASILNKHGGGTLYFGVKDNGDVIGQDIGRDTERKLSREISDNISPPIWYEIKACRTDEGADFLEVSFHGEHSPYAAFGRYYQRFADEDKHISDTQLVELFRNRLRDYSQWESEVSAETVADADVERLQRVIEDGNEAGRIPFGCNDIKTVLSKLGLLSATGDKLTNAGRVLFSKNHPVLLKTAVYATETRDTFLKLHHFEGNIFDCIDEGIAFVMAAIDRRVEITGKARRTEEPEIPPKAVREMIVNAFAHGSYSANTAFTIEVFRDRVVIYSPGLFPLGFKQEDFAEAAAEPIMLNPKIVNVLFKASVIESFGSGYERTFGACRQAGVKYAYANTKTGFRFIFYRPLGQKKAYKMSPSEKAVFDSLCDCDYLSNAQLAEKIGRTEKTVYRALKALKQAGLIARKTDADDAYWEILFEVTS